MSTIPQRNANRRNSLKSTGPRTDAGKAASSQNALKTGIYSQAEVIYGENAGDLTALTDEYYLHHHPESPEARALVDVLIHSEWTLRRLRHAEAQLWKLYMDRNHHDENGKDSLGFAFDRSDGEVFARLQRRIDSTQRNFQRALKDLQQLQASKPASDPVARIEPQSADTIGFVPSSVPSPAAESAQATVQSPIGFVPSSAPVPIRVHSCSFVARNSTYSNLDDRGVCL